MSLALNYISSGTFVSNAVSQVIPVSADIVQFDVYNLTQFGSTAASTVVEHAKWIQGLAAGSAYLDAKTTGAATTSLQQMVLVNGFTLQNTGAGAQGAPVAISAVSQANPAVVSTGSTAGLVASQSLVRMTNVTGMQQISGQVFLVGTIVANTSFQLVGLDSSGFGAAGTGGSYEIVSFDAYWYPRRRFVTKITQAAQAVVSTAEPHGMTVGQLVRMIVPAAFGMIQMNGLLGTVVAVGSATSFTLNINSSGFTAFAYPTSAVAAAGVSFALMIPVGEAAVVPYQNLLDDATLNTAQSQMLLGSAVVGSSSDLMRWIAYRQIAQ